MKATDIDKLVTKIDTYLAVLRMSGSYKERQRINLTNQALPGFIEESRREVLAAVARGALCDAFLREREAAWPTPGRPLPEQFAQYVERAIAVQATKPGPPTEATLVAKAG